MATFISVSGPSLTGKTSLINALSTHKAFSGAVFSPDFHEVVWNELVENGYFTTWKELTSDSEYLCVYIIRLVDYYKKYIDRYKDTDKLVILDGCWVDLIIYTMMSLWYKRSISEVQEDIMRRVSSLEKNISRFYFTRFDERLSEKSTKGDIKNKIANLKSNRSLEMRYYEMFENIGGAINLPSSDITESSMFIIDDLSNLGYL